MTLEEAQTLARFVKQFVPITQPAAEPYVIKNALPEMPPSKEREEPRHALVAALTAAFPQFVWKVTKDRWWDLTVELKK